MLNWSEAGHLNGRGSEKDSKVGNPDDSQSQGPNFGGQTTEQKREVRTRR
jgi:hypothetical protein